MKLYANWLSYIIIFSIYFWVIFYPKMLKYIKLCKSAIIFKLRGCWSCWRSESIETWVISKQFTMTFPHYILVFVISILFIYITYISISRDEKIVIDLKECLIKERVINNFVVTYINNLFLLSLNVLCSIKIYFVNWVILQLISWGSHYLSCFNQDFLFLFNDMKFLDDKWWLPQEIS